MGQEKTLPEQITEVTSQMQMEPLRTDEELQQQITEEITQMEKLFADEPESLATAQIDKADETTAEEKMKRRAFGAVRFYGFLLCTALGVLILLCCLMIPLNNWLKEFEIVQPNDTRDEIFELLFAEPDWALLYDMANIDDTPFEGRDDYVAYMEAKVGNRALQCVEVAAGLSIQRRFSVRLGEEEIAAFTMVPCNGGGDLFDPWTLSNVEVFLNRQETVTVILMPEHTAYINGVPLDDSYITVRAYTVAEEYLPEDLDGYHYEQQQITGLLRQPDVVVLDEYNNPLELTWDADTGYYYAPIVTSQSIEPGCYNMVREAIRAEALFAIRAISISQLRQYFDSGSQAYADIIAAEAMNVHYVSYAFDDMATSISGYYQYRDGLFSVRATVRLNLTDGQGNVTSYDFTSTYFCRTKGNSYVVTERLDVDLQELVYCVPVTYLFHGTALRTDWVTSQQTQMSAPVVMDYQGKLPVYWAMEDAEGNTIPVLQVHADGSCTLMPGQTLRAMQVFPVFTDEVSQ